MPDRPGERPRSLRIRAGPSKGFRQIRRLLLAAAASKQASLFLTMGTSQPPTTTPTQISRFRYHYQPLLYQITFA